MLLCHFRKGHLQEEVIASANQSWLMLWCRSESGMVLLGSDIILCGECCNMEVSQVFKIFTLVIDIRMLLFGCCHDWLTLLLIYVLFHFLNSAIFFNLLILLFLKMKILGKNGFQYFLKLWWYSNSWCLQRIQVRKLTKGNLRWAMSSLLTGHHYQYVANW